MDFIILSINGRDVSNSSHEEAVRLFESAQEPITIQVLRKSSVRTITGGSELEIGAAATAEQQQKKSTSVQTDLVGLINEDYVENYYVFEDGEEYDFENEADDGEEGEEFDEIFANSVVGPHQMRNYKLREDVYFQEVTLKKSTSNEKLGLTVCYNYSSDRDNSSEAAEVYISEICKDSLAARDGRLREGDQILQVNGRDIESKEQTEKVFAQTKNTVVILVSRCQYHQASTSSPPCVEDVPAYQNSMIELLVQQQQKCQFENSGESLHTDNSPFRGSSTCKSPPPPVPSHNVPTTSCNINTTSSSCSSQNSHGSNKDGITEKNTNYGGDNFLKDSIKKIDDLTITGKRNRKLFEPSSDSEHIYETIPESEAEPIYSSPYESKLNIRRSEAGHDHRSKSSKSSSSVEEKDSSSAYNTGESCHSNPLVLELHKDPRELRGSTLILCQSDAATSRSRPQPSPPTCDIAENQVIRTIQSSLSAPQFINHHQLTPEKEDKKFNSSYYQASQYQHHQYQIPYQYYQQPYHSQNVANNRISWDNRDRESTGSGIMYTNVDNLEQTMMFQQQIFTQALNRKNVTNKETKIKNTKSRDKFRAPNLTQYHFIGSQQVRQLNTTDMQEEKCDPRLEWKVKRRPDGTRYIVRRQSRNKLLGNRTLEISEERAGITTEDDTVSEIKLGRYWSKDERKRHLEQARQRKQRQAIIKNQVKSSQCHELANCDQGEDNKEGKKSTQDMTLISVNKMMDELQFCGANSKPAVGLLSVTTV